MADHPSAKCGSDRFVITGCQRSGTTLVAMALEAHPLIEIIEENDVRFHYPGKITHELNLQAASRQLSKDQLMIGYKAPRDSHRTETVKETFPFMRILWVERELRQTVSSMLSLGGASNSWAESFAPKEISKHILKTQDKKVRRLFEQTVGLENHATRSTALATLCWLVKREQRILTTRLMGPQVLVVNYDALVTEPERQLRKVLDFLGLPWGPMVLEHPLSIAKDPRPGQADPHRTIDILSLNKWRSSLSSSDLEVIAATKHSFECNEDLKISIKSRDIQ